MTKTTADLSTPVAEATSAQDDNALSGALVWNICVSEPSRSAQEPALHRGRIYQACLLELQPAAREHGEVRNALDVVPRCELRVPLGVNLEDDGPSGEIAGGLLYVRRGHAARTAPGRPEIHQHGNLAVTNDLIKLRRADLDGLSHRWQGRLARAASSRVGNVLRRNAIRFPA